MSEEQARQFLDQATQSLQSGQFQQALELVDQSIALKEADSEAHVLRGIALSQLSQPDQATEAFRRAISLGPYNSKAYFNLAVHYFGLGQKPEALEMAREAVRIDAKHAGARDLIARIEGESQAAGTIQAPTTPDPSRIGDPLAQPTETPSGVAPGPGGPAPGTPYQNVPPPGGYYRPGYETSGVHSLQFVANMGKTWDTIAWVLIITSVATFVISLVMFLPMYAEIFQNPQNMQRMSTMGFGSSIASTILQIVSWLATLSSLVWMILELSDRRGNWLWLLPYILCCCCGFHWVPMGIYLLAGRQK